MRIKDMSAKDVLDQVEKLENKSVASGDIEHQKAYDLMKDYIKRLHPGTRGL